MLAFREEDTQVNDVDSHHFDCISHEKISNLQCIDTIQRYHKYISCFKSQRNAERNIWRELLFYERKDLNGIYFYICLIFSRMLVILTCTHRDFIITNKFIHRIEYHFNMFINIRFN